MLLRFKSGTFLSYLVALFYSVNSMPTRSNFSRSDDHNALHFSDTLLTKFSHLSLLDNMLVRPSFGVGRQDLYYASVDGIVGGVEDFLHCPGCSLNRRQWFTHMENEHFVTAPLEIAVPGIGDNLLLLFSNRGSLILLDRGGHLLSQLRIPEILIKTPPSQQLPVKGVALQDLNLLWDDGGDEHFEVARLTPKVYTSVLILSDACSPSKADTDLVCIVLPVNFMSRDLILASLLAINAQALLSTHLAKTSHELWQQSTALVPLELDHLHTPSPSYMFSALVPISSPVGPKDFGRPNVALLVTLANGAIYRISLPVRHITADSSLLWRPGGRSVQRFSHACHILDCPRATHWPTHKRPLLCCLVLDDASNLRLITLDVNSHLHDSKRVLWTYRPAMESSVRGGQQIGAVSLVPGACMPIKNCDLWAVYATPDGFAHVVDVNSGGSVTNFPLMLINDSTPSHLFFAGPGLLYTPDGQTSWMLFSDTFGGLYHLQLTARNPIMFTSFRPEHKLSSPLVSSWISPTPVTLKSSARESLGLLLSNISGISLLLPVSALCDSNLVQFDAVFLDDHGQPTTVLHLNKDHQSVSYRIHNCPLITEPGLSVQTSYRALMVDSRGHPLSTWSIPTVTQPMSTPSLLGFAPCQGTLDFIYPVQHSFRQWVHLRIINTQSGFMIPSASMLLLDAHTFWPEVLILCTYMPLVYFCCGLLYLQWRQWIDEQQATRPGCPI